MGWLPAFWESAGTLVGWVRSGSQLCAGSTQTSIACVENSRLSAAGVPTLSLEPALDLCLCSVPLQSSLGELPDAGR